MIRSNNDPMRAEESRAHLAAIVENSNDAIVVRSRDGNIASWNATAERMFGWTAKEAIGQPISIIVPPERKGEMKPLVERVMTGETLEPIESLHRRKDGVRIETSVTLSPIRNNQSEVTSISLIYRDITAQKSAQKLLRASEQRFRAMFDHAGVGITMRPAHDRRHPWTQVNDHFCTMLGYTREELLRLSTTDITPPDEQGPAASDNTRLLNGEIAHYDREKQILRKDGSRIWVNLSVSSLPDATGRAENLIAVYQDISERKRAQDMQERLAAITRSSGDAIVSCDLNDHIESWNPAAENVFGYTASEAIGKPMMLIVPPERGLSLRHQIEQVAAGKQVDNVTTTHRRKDGTIINTSVRFSAITNTKGQIVSIARFFRDITQEMHLEGVARKKAQMTELLETLARTANEAPSPGAAIETSLQRIAEHGRWQLAHALIFKQGGGVRNHLLSLWNNADDPRFANFIRESEIHDYSDGEGHFLSRVISNKKPVWIENLDTVQHGSRISRVVATGMRNGFAFPIILRDEVVAVLEFFGSDPQPPDQLLIDNISIFSAQLARLIEREHAETTIRTSEARLRAILDNEPECVKVIGENNTLLEMNRAGLAMLEVESISQARKHGLANFVMPEYRKMFHDGFLKVMGGEPVTMEFEIKGARGTRLWMESRAVPIDLPGDGGRAMLAIARDVTAHRKAQEKITYLSQYDVLTGLPNRNLFRDRLGLAVARGKRHGEMTGIMLVNVDRFKQVNDGLGLKAGDDLLRQIAERLKDTLRDVDTIARLSGDEFAILAEDVPGSTAVIAIAEKLVEAFAAPFTVMGTEVIITASIGTSMHPNGTDNPDILIEHAETAMATIKNEGGSGYRAYENESITLRSQRLSLETCLRRALDRGELELHYQPKLRLLDGDTTGAEALLRWNSPEFGAVSPAKFIPVAEESGLIIPIGAWVLRTACMQMQSWHAQGHAIDIAVNLSPRQFRQKDLAGIVASVLQESGLPPEYLELEITEGTAMANVEQAAKVLGELHDLGIKLAVDDFGTGYSSLAYLKRFPLDSLKIDRSFVIDVGLDPGSEAIMCATIALAHSLSLKVVAEGVETEAQRDFLVAAGCNEIQGYLYSRPLPAAEFVEFLRKQRSS